MVTAAGLHEEAHTINLTVVMRAKHFTPSGAADRVDCGHYPSFPLPRVAG